jgi:hypothetical protein
MLPICNYSAPGSATVGTSSAEAVPENPNREGLIITNLRANTGIFYLGFGSHDAEIGKGVPLYPGGSFFMDARSFTTAAVNAISDVAAQALSYQEM